MTIETTEQIEPSKETLEQPTLSDLMKAITDLSGKVDGISERLDAQDLQLKAIRQGLVENSARFDQLEALAHDAKSIALITRSQLTILTEQMRRDKALV